jgi:hypothetical protein
LKIGTLDRAKFFAYLQLPGDQARGRSRTDRRLVSRQVSEFLGFWRKAALRRRSARSQYRELLVPVYGWFTEGHDTLDLRNARNLLDS